MSHLILFDRMQRLVWAEQSNDAILKAFVSQRDPDAFAALVERFGPLVWSVCRRQLGDCGAADDATQATFLTLIRKIERIRPASLAGWLVCVAQRICRKRRSAEQRRKRREAFAAPTMPVNPIDELSMREVLALLDAELARLPERYRAPLLACYWQGQTQEQAARQLKMSPAAVKGLLERGRAKLVARLQQRGLTSDVVLRGLLIAPLAVTALPDDLFAHTAAFLKGPAPQAIVELLPAGGWFRWGACAITAIALGAGLILIPGAMPQDPMKNPPPAPVNKPAPKPKEDALGDPLPPGALLRLGTLRFKHPNSAHALALSPDGKVVITAGNQQIIAWESATGKQLWNEPEPQIGGMSGSYAGENPMAFDPSGNLITPALANSFAIWNTATGRNRTVTVNGALANRQGHISSVDISSDGKTVVLGTSRGVFLTDFDGNVRKQLPMEPAGRRDQNDRLLFHVMAHGAYSFARFSPDGKTVVITSNQSKTLRLCNPTSGDERRQIELTAYLVRLAFSPDSKRVAVTERDNALRVYDVETGKRLHSWVVNLNNPFENYTSAVAFSPDGKLIAAGATDHLIRLWDTTSGKEVGQLKGTGWYPWGLAFSSDGKILYSTGWDGIVRRWDVPARKQLPLPDGGIRGSEVVAASPDGKMLAYVDEADIVRIIDPRTGQELMQLKAEDGGASHLAFSRDSRMLAAGGSHGGHVHVVLWNLATGKDQRRWDWEKGRDPHSTVEDIVFSPDGKQIAVAVFRRSELWILNVDGEKQRALAHESIYGLDFSPDGKTVATAGWDRCIRLWDASTGELRNQAKLESEKGEDLRMYGVRYSPDGRFLACGLMNGEVFVSDAKSLALKHRFAIQGSFTFNAMAYSPDGLRLATGDSEGRVRVWDSQTGVKLLERNGHSGHMYVLSFGRDSRTLLAGGNGVGYLWDLRPSNIPQTEPAELWKDMTSADAVVADLAFWALIDRPKEAVELFAKNIKVKRAEAADPDATNKLINDLDNDKFAKREAASADLAKLGPGALPLLKKALSAGGSAEKQRRLHSLIDRLVDDDATIRRHQRFVAVLRHLKTNAATEMLRDWANNGSGSLAELAAMALKGPAH
jgi:RNA polymerase sigma factor (sigma-70 family)